MASVHDFSVKTITGDDKSLSDYAGKVLLVVNVASACGLTPQYAGLQSLHETYAARGLSVLGFPANEFGAQEPGTNGEIKTFCETRFGVTFDMFAKVVVKGEGKHPLFAHLVAESGGKEIGWNFGKFLVGKDGSVLARFEPTADPKSADVTQAIEKALG